jgi:hypothetical protein
MGRACDMRVVSHDGDDWFGRQRLEGRADPRSRNRTFFWDKRSNKHLAVHDAGPFRRIMRRTQIVDDRVY